MKSTDGTLIALLATGQVSKCELYEFALAEGTTLRYTTNDAPVTALSQTWNLGMQIERGNVLQKVGLEVQTLNLKLVPQSDHPGGPLLTTNHIGQRRLEGARVTMYKAFLNGTTWIAVNWFQGRIGPVQVGRFAAEVVVNSDTELLNVAMPRNIVQMGCVHTLFDAGCALPMFGAFSTTLTVTGTGPNTLLSFTTGATQADDYFTLGRIKWLTGANAGRNHAVRAYTNSAGRVTVVNPMKFVPQVGDQCDAFAGCDKRQITCQNKFNNIARFRGYPFVPVPETLYDGGPGANAQSTQTFGGQGGVPGAGTGMGGRFSPRNAFDNQ